MSIPIQRAQPGPGQESVWDYPRPPRVEPAPRHIQVFFIQGHFLSDSRQVTLCEWKGEANYFDVTVGGRTAENAAWTYHQPTPGYEAIGDHVAFYPQVMDQCLVDGEAAAPMPGGFYGGWVTRDVVGPFKGGPGTEGW